jgi:hypothetical protein
MAESEMLADEIEFELKRLRRPLVRPLCSTCLMIRRINHGRLQPHVAQRRATKIAHRGEMLTRWRQRMGEEKMNEHCHI